MPPPNGNPRIRSSNRNKTNTKELQIATPRAPLIRHSSAPTSISPSRVKPSPPGKQNKTSPQNVSIPPIIIKDNKRPNILQKQSDQGRKSVTKSISQKNNGVSSSTSSNVRPPEEVSDNGGTFITAVSSEYEASTGSSMQNTSQQSSDFLSNSSTMTPQPINSQTPSDPLTSSPTDPWHLTYTELHAMRVEFAQQLQAISSRNAFTESKVSTNSEKIKELEERLQSLKDTVENQQQAIMILEKEKQQTTHNRDNIKEVENQFQSLKVTVDNHQQAIKELGKEKQQTTHNLENMKTDFAKTKDEFSQSSKRAMSEMNSLLEQHHQQVLSFRGIKEDIQQCSQQQKEDLRSFKTVQTDIQKDVQQQFKHISEDIAFKDLKDQAFKNRFNIVVTGIPENESYSVLSQANHFFKTKMKFKKFDLETAYRKGQLPPNNNNYIRPLVIKFSRLPDRNLVWRSRYNIPQQEGHQQVRIHADLPKELRQEVSTLYRVVRAAQSLEEFRTASVKGYMVELHGKQYSNNKNGS